MEVLIGASFIAAFIAGFAALFAPCCITVLLPAYLGSIFTQKRTVFLMTFTFFLGLLAVFLPLGLGVAGLGQLFRANHNFIYIGGGLFSLGLGAFVLLGGHLSIPSSPHRNVDVKGAGSVFLLGIFSGLSTLCCAPVLAGVLALSVLPGSLFWGGMYSLAYVLGMSVPLFFLAYFLDRTDVAEKVSAMGKQISYALGRRRVDLSIADMVSGGTFLAIGAIIFYLALTNRLTAEASEYQATLNAYLFNLTNSIKPVLGKVPVWAWVALPLVIVALVVVKVVWNTRKAPPA